MQLENGNCVFLKVEKRKMRWPLDPGLLQKADINLREFF